MNKSVLGVRPSPAAHWVGDGFPVQSLFSYDDLGREALSPFLLLDYAAPARFEPSARPRGVGEHPHRGFETVTIVYQGGLAHRDSVGNQGLIGPGDVQWMTAASGILHEEFHSPDFRRQGGVLEMAQLWVNLPARHKMAPPRYQTLLQAHIPGVDIPGVTPNASSGTAQTPAAARVRVIAGRFGDTRGPALTYSELNVWDVRLRADSVCTLPIPSGHTAALALLRGAVTVNGTQRVSAPAIVVLDRGGDAVTLSAAASAATGAAASTAAGAAASTAAGGGSGSTDDGAVLLVLSGVPFDEAVVGYGPFVMNTRAEIETAMRDFQSGKFGRMAALESSGVD